MSDDAQSRRRAAVVADLVGGATLLATSLKHGVAQATASKWMAESGLTRARVPRVSTDKLDTIKRLLRAGVGVNEIRRRVHCNTPIIARVRAALEMEKEARDANA